jgi:hypothetical protein
MKLLIIITLAGLSLSYLSANELESLKEDQLKPYDRCMASYQGSSLASQCEVLKLKGE